MNWQKELKFLLPLTFCKFIFLEMEREYFLDLIRQNSISRGKNLGLGEESSGKSFKI